MHNSLARVFLTAILAASFGISAAATAQEKLSIDQCVQAALDSNPTVRIAEENIRRTAADIDQASAEGMPKVVLDSTFTRNNKESTAAFGGNDIVLSPLDTRVANVSFRQPLDVFGIIKMGRRMAHLGRVSAEYDYDKVKNDTILQAKQAYYNVLRADEYIRVQQESVRQLEAHLADAQSNLKAGTVAKFEVLRAETEVANARVALISASNGLALAKSALNNVMGRDLGTPVELETSKSPELIDVDMTACIDSACKHRPEVMSANTNLELSNKMITIANRGSKPKIDLLWKGNENYTPTSMSPSNSSWNASLTGNVALYDGGATKAAVSKARSDASNAKSGLDQVVLFVTLDTRQAYLSVNEAKERIVAAEKGLELARESSRLAEVRYKGGISTQTEVLDAQSALVQAETHHTNAVYDYQVAVAKLEQAVGGSSQMAKLIEMKSDVHQASNTVK